MRRINSDFRTKFISEEGQKLANRDYFGYVEMDDFACYVLADSLDGDMWEEELPRLAAGRGHRPG